MCLRFVFLLITRLAAWLRLSRREEAWKTAEILILHHQLAVLQRQQLRRPNLNWADRALLTTLLSVIPKARRQGLRLLVTPDTILRWRQAARWLTAKVPAAARAALPRRAGRRRTAVASPRPRVAAPPQSTPGLPPGQPRPCGTASQPAS